MNSNFSPTALKEARIAREYTQTQLAVAIGISKQAISLIEKGEHEPKDENLIAISNELHLPLTYFFRTPIEDFAKESPVFWRRLASARDAVQAKASVKAKWHYNGYLQLTKYLRRINANLPKFYHEQDYDYTKLTEDDLEDYAEELRQFWGLNLSAIEGLTPLLERNGVIIFQLDIPADINGFSFYANGKTPFVICSKNVSATRHRFNCMHEMAHLLLHNILEDETELLQNHKLIEHQANYFASAFLFPKQKFLDEFFSTDINILLSLKEKWGLSITAIVKRACNLGILTTEEESTFYRRNPGIRKKEPKDEQIIIEQPTFPKNGLKAILDAHLITIDDLKSELPYNINDLSEMFYLDTSFFEPQAVVGSKETSNIIEFKSTA